MADDKVAALKRHFRTYHAGYRVALCATCGWCWSCRIYARTKRAGPGGGRPGGCLNLPDCRSEMDDD